MDKYIIATMIAAIILLSALLIIRTRQKFRIRSQKRSTLFNLHRGLIKWDS